MPLLQYLSPQHNIRDALFDMLYHFITHANYTSLQDLASQYALLNINSSLCSVFPSILKHHAVLGLIPYLI